MANRYECDCHCHTTRSDGKNTPKELIDLAAEHGLKGLAIVDHDITPPLIVSVIGPNGLKSDISIFDYAKLKNIKLVLGYEFSSDTYVDDVHIVGYNLDWQHPAILEEVRRAAESKSNAYQELTEVLTKNNMPISFEDDILTYKKPDGQMATRTRDEVQRKHIFECMSDKGYAKSWNDAKLLVRDNPAFNIPRKKINPLDAIQMIHDANGLAVLAHPFLIDEEVSLEGKSKISREKYIGRFLELKLDGIESFYTYEKTSYKGSMTRYQVRDLIEKKYANHVDFFSAGSDYHGESQSGSKVPRYLGECGLTLDRFEEIFF